MGEVEGGGSTSKIKLHRSKKARVGGTRTADTSYFPQAPWTPWLATQWVNKLWEEMRDPTQSLAAKHLRQVLAESTVLKLTKAYHDLETMVQSLRAQLKRPDLIPPVLQQFNLEKLLHQLIQSKQQLERRIKNTLLLEKEALTQKLRQHFKW